MYLNSYRKGKSYLVDVPREQFLANVPRSSDLDLRVSVFYENYTKKNKKYTKKSNMQMPRVAGNHLPPSGVQTQNSSIGKKRIMLKFSKKQSIEYLIQ